jgi:hypothetical protein
MGPGCQADRAVRPLTPFPGDPPPAGRPPTAASIAYVVALLCEMAYLRLWARQIDYS